MLLKPVFEGLQVVFDMRVLGKGKEKYLLLRDVEQEKKKLNNVLVRRELYRRYLRNFLKGSKNKRLMKIGNKSNFINNF